MSAREQTIGLLTTFGALLEWHAEYIKDMYSVPGRNDPPQWDEDGLLAYETLQKVLRRVYRQLDKLERAG
jgi:hypothetical protein